MRIAVINPAKKPRQTHAPIFSIYPARPPVIIPPVTTPNDIYFVPTLPLFMNALPM